jgi:hypothetical protein
MDVCAAAEQPLPNCTAEAATTIIIITTTTTTTTATNA